MRPSTRSVLFVSAQMGLILWILFTGPVVAQNTIWLVLELAGLALGLWAVGTVGLSKLSIFPEARIGAPLVVRGPYRAIRHPMYTAVLLTCLVLVLDAPSFLRAFALLALLLVLVAKLTYEERLLLGAYGDYALYRQRTKRLVPWLY